MKLFDTKSNEKEKEKAPLSKRSLILGAPEPTRTADPQLRRLLLYPAELRAQRHNNKEMKGVTQYATFQSEKASVTSSFAKISLNQRELHLKKNESALLFY